MGDAARLILASQSKARRSMLAAAGIAVECQAADIDEAAIRDGLTTESACVEASDIALHLAVEKALTISRVNPGAYVIGSDQVLALGSHVFSKVATKAEARETLDRLRGRTHDLVSAAAIARDGAMVWQGYQTAQLTMRRFSDEFLGRYLESAGDALTQSVGCYELEGQGVQLFDAVDGDYFTILGMPLLLVLAQLRQLGVVST